MDLEGIEPSSDDIQLRFILATFYTILLIGIEPIPPASNAGILPLKYSGYLSDSFTIYWLFYEKSTPRVLVLLLNLVGGRGREPRSPG